MAKVCHRVRVEKIKDEDSEGEEGELSESMDGDLGTCTSWGCNYLCMYAHDDKISYISCSPEWTALHVPKEVHFGSAHLSSASHRARATCGS